jgi:hypothetical protein
LSGTTEKCAPPRDPGLGLPCLMCPILMLIRY